MELFIRRRTRLAERVQIWPNTEVPVGAVTEAEAYIIEGEGDRACECDLYIDDSKLLALRGETPDKAAWLWEPGFYAGEVEFTLLRGRRLVGEGIVTLDPNVAKLTRMQFDAMLCEIMEDCHALFALSQARKGVAEGDRTFVPPIAVLEFLRGRLGPICKAVQIIADRPARLLAAEARRLRPSEMTKCRPHELNAAFRSQSIRELPANHPMATGVFGAAKCFPVCIDGLARTTTLDIAENRAVKTELRRLLSWLNIAKASLIRHSEKEKPPEGGLVRGVWARRCDAMVRTIQNLLALPVFSDISDGFEPLRPSSLFRLGQGYNQFYRLSQEIRRGLGKVTGDFLNVPLSRTFDLYEMWAFLRLVRAAVTLFEVHGKDVAELLNVTKGRANTLVVNVGAVRIPLNSSLTLCFKREFREYWRGQHDADLCGSYSRPMIPDVSLEIRNPRDGRISGIVVIDAKYRLETQLGDALSSLHTYLDAIVLAKAEESSEGKPAKAVIAAFVVTPVNAEKFDFEGLTWKQFTVAPVLFHPEYRKLFRFGAVPLVPGKPFNDVVTAFRDMLETAGHKL